MKTIKGPGIFLAQFAGDEAPFNTLAGMVNWAAGLGLWACRFPVGMRACFDLKLAAESQAYCDEVLGVAAQAGLAVTELSTHLQGQFVATHPAYDTAFADFRSGELKQDAKARQAWAVEQLLFAAKASQRMGLTAHATFSGALAWPFFYPVAAAAGWTDRRSLCRTGPPLAADPQCV
jgi:sugar phosphate isomerase/epimerase